MDSILSRFTLSVVLVAASFTASLALSEFSGASWSPSGPDVNPLTSSATPAAQYAAKADSDSLLPELCRASAIPASSHQAYRHP